MRKRRSVIGPLLAAALIAGAPAPVSADPAPPDLEAAACPRMGADGKTTTFEATAGTVVGGWRVDGKNASLCFRGAGGTEGPGAIVATWTTPWDAPPSQEFGVEYGISTLNPTTKVKYEMSLRFRPRGEHWSPWWTYKYGMARPSGSAGGGMGVVIVYAIAKGQKVDMPKIQWQWRFTVLLPQPTVIDASATMYSR